MRIDLSGPAAAAAIAGSENLVGLFNPVVKEQIDQVKQDREQLKAMFERAHVIGIVARHLLATLKEADSPNPETASRSD